MSESACPLSDLDPSAPEEMPSPSAVVILFRIAMKRWLASLPKEDALNVLRGIAEDLAMEQSLSNVLLLRPPPEEKEENIERRRAVALFRRLLPVWLAAIDEEG